MTNLPLNRTAYELPFPLSICDLPPCHIHVVIFLVDQFRDRYDLISLFPKPRDYPFQRIRRIFRPIVAENNGTVSEILMVQDCIYDAVCPVILPVKAIHTCCKIKITRTFLLYAWQR